MNINYWALLVSIVVSVPLGMLWYGPLFGKPWMKLSGITMPEVKPSMSVMIKPVIISLIGALFLAFSIANSISIGKTLYHLSGLTVGLQVAFFNWLGYVVPVNLSFVAWEGKSWKLFFIHTGYWLVLLGIMGLIFTF